MIDFLIVGGGLAGVSFAEIALSNNRTVLVIDNDGQSSSKAAAGLYNPVVLKRFTPAWNAHVQLPFMRHFFDTLEERLGAKFCFDKPIFRRFSSIEEQNNWFVAGDHNVLRQYLSPTLINDHIVGVNSPYDYGEVFGAGYVDVSMLLLKYSQLLSMSNMWLKEQFDYNHISVLEDHVKYRNYQVQNVIFAEGFALLQNPYFGYLPLVGLKGELLIIHAPDLQMEVIVNSGIFILPIGNELYKVGATYNWKDKSAAPTVEGRSELLEKLKEFASFDFQVVNHIAGVRPTVRDRRPLIGTHNIHRRLHVLNGLGSRGVMVGPSMAKALFEHIEFGSSLPANIDIRRFDRN